VISTNEGCGGQEGGTSWVVQAIDCTQQALLVNGLRRMMLSRAKQRVPTGVPEAVPNVAERFSALSLSP
jgi:hypothetical protein